MSQRTLTNASPGSGGCEVKGHQVLPRLDESGTQTTAVLSKQSYTRYRPYIQALDRTLTADAQAPEIQQMYSLNMPVSSIRTKTRQEFERHRYVQHLKTIDVLLFNSHQEYQVRPGRGKCFSTRLGTGQD